MAELLDDLYDPVTSFSRLQGRHSRKPSICSSLFKDFHQEPEPCTSGSETDIVVPFFNYSHCWGTVLAG